MRLISVVMLCQALFLIGIQGSRPIISLYASYLGASTLHIGLLVSAYAFLPMFFSIQIGKMADRYGAKQMMVIGTVGILLGLLLPILVPSLFFLFLNHLVCGISIVCVLVSLQKIIGNSQGNRDRLVSAFSVAGAFGESIGPLITGVLFTKLGFRGTLLAMILIVILAGIVCITGLKKKVSLGPTSIDLVKQASHNTWLMLQRRNLRKALMVSGIVLYTKDLFIAYFPIYGDSVGLSPFQIGLIISLSSIMAMIVRLLQFQLVNLLGRGKVMMLILIISGTAFLLFPATKVIIIFILLSVLLGAGLGLGQPLSIVYALNDSPQVRHGEVLGLRLTLNRFSQFVAPLVLGSIGQFGGVKQIFFVNGLVLLFVSYFTRMKEDSEISEKG